MILVVNMSQFSFISTSTPRDLTPKSRLISRGIFIMGRIGQVVITFKNQVCKKN